MRLSKLQRHTMYIILHYEVGNISSIDQDVSTGEGIFGTCYCFNRIADSIFFTSQVEKILPELFNKRTTNNNNIWFKNKKQRLTAIEQCVEETF